MINLVTGGAGFIGSNLIERLLSLNESVICIDDLSVGNINSISKFESDNKFKFFKHNVEDPLDIKVDKIWHLASLAAQKYIWRIRSKPLTLASLALKICLNWP